MPDQQPSYFAHGHPSQHDAYQWLFAPPGAEGELHTLFEFSDIFGDTGGAREDATCPPIADLLAGFNLHNTVITYVAQHHALLIRRPELLSRGGFLREGVLNPTSAPAPVLRYLAALAPKPTINQIEQTARQFASQITQLQNAQPLLQLFTPAAANLTALQSAKSTQSNRIHIFTICCLWCIQASSLLYNASSYYVNIFISVIFT